jgi:uncharacterized membrane protein YesL
MRTRIPHGVLSTVFEVAYLGLVTNALLVVACLPFVATLVASDPAVTWPVLVALAPLTLPAFVATCQVFADSSDGVVRTFGRAWRRSFGKASALGVLVTALVTVLVVDVRALFGQRVGAVVIPILVVLALLAVATAIHAVVVLADAPTARLRDVLWWSTFLAVRRWYLAGVSLVVLGVQTTFLGQHPALALGLSATPVLYVVWANTRHALRPAFVAAAEAGAAA